MDIRNIPHSHRNQPMKMAEISLKDYESDFLDKLTFLEKEMSLSSVKNLRDLCRYFDKDESFIVKMISKIKIKDIKNTQKMVEDISEEMSIFNNKENNKESFENILNQTNIQGLLLENPFNVEDKIIALEEEDKSLNKKLKDATDSDSYFDLIERKRNTVKATYICLLSKNINKLSQLNLTKGVKYATLILQNSNYQRALLVSNKIETPVREERKIKNERKKTNTRRMDMKLKKGS